MWLKKKILIHTTIGCLKYSLTAASRKLERLMPWNDSWYQKLALENCSIYKASSVNGATCRSPCVGYILPVITIHYVKWTTVENFFCYFLPTRQLSTTDDRQNDFLLFLVQYYQICALFRVITYQICNCFIMKIYWTSILRQSDHE